MRGNRRGRARSGCAARRPRGRGSDRCAGTLTLKRGGRVLARATFKVAVGAWGRARIKLPAGGAGGCAVTRRRRAASPAATRHAPPCNHGSALIERCSLAAALLVSAAATAQADTTQPGSYRGASAGRRARADGRPDRLGGRRRPERTGIPTYVTRLYSAPLAGGRRGRAHAQIGRRDRRGRVLRGVAGRRPGRRRTADRVAHVRLVASRPASSATATSTFRSRRLDGSGLRPGSSGDVRAGRRHARHQRVQRRDRCATSPSRGSPPETARRHAGGPVKRRRDLRRPGGRTPASSCSTAPPAPAPRSTPGCCPARGAGSTSAPKACSPSRSETFTTGTSSGPRPPSPPGTRSSCPDLDYDAADPRPRQPARVPGLRRRASASSGSPTSPAPPRRCSPSAPTTSRPTPPVRLRRDDVHLG